MSFVQIAVEYDPAIPMKPLCKYCRSRVANPRLPYRWKDWGEGGVSQATPIPNREKQG